MAHRKSEKEKQDEDKNMAATFWASVERKAQALFIRDSRKVESVKRVCHVKVREKWSSLCDSY